MFDNRSEILETNDSLIVKKRSAFKIAFTRAIAEIASPIIGKGYVGLTEEQRKLLGEVVVDAVAVLKVGRTQNERLRKGRHKGRDIILDPIEFGWIERMKKVNIEDVNSAVSVVHNASLEAVNSVPGLTSTPVLK